MSPKTRNQLRRFVSGQTLGVFGRESVRNLNVLVLTTSYPSDEKDWSGIFIAKLLEAIARRGHRVKVVAPSDGSFHGKRTVHGIDTRRFGYFLPKSLEKLTRGGGGIPENMSESVLAKIQVLPMMCVFAYVALRHARTSDVIYANWLGAGVVGALVNLITGRPLIVSFRGDDGYLARDRLLWRLFTRWVIRRAVIVAPVSTEIAEIMRTLGTPESKLDVPRFGVDTEMFHPAELPRDSEEPVRVLYVGALIPKKGLQTLFQAMEGTEWGSMELIIVGDGYYASELKDMCSRAGLDAHTRWTGSLPPREVADIMRVSDLLCLPSHTEGSPNVIKEAMASGLPVLATRVGGIPDLVAHEETGMLFEPGDAQELRRSLQRLVGESELRRSMGSAGLESLKRAGLDWDSTAEDFDRLFDRAIS